MEDWTVPLVFEAAPIRLFPSCGWRSFEIKLEHSVRSGLPAAPDIGFIGRDETILRLDRTFDEHSVVLLHAYAGSGKTSTAAEFARWYRQTGGISGPVLFTTFEQHKALPRVLDELGRAFEGVLAKSGIQWLTLDDTKRRELLCKFWAGSGTLDLGQRGADCGISGGHGLGMERGGAKGTAGFPARRARHQGEVSVDLAPR